MPTAEVCNSRNETDNAHCAYWERRMKTDKLKVKKLWLVGVAIDQIPSITRSTLQRSKVGS